jgi:hypothetical protein
LKKLGIASEAIILSGGYTGKTLQRKETQEKILWCLMKTKNCNTDLGCQENRFLIKN